MFDGVVEIRKSSHNKVIMTVYEDGKLLKLKGCFATVQNFAYMSQLEEGNLSSSVLWHARFGHLNYNSLRLLKKNGVYGLPTIPKRRNKCDACILGKHSKQSFQESKFRVCRKLELVHYNLCFPMPIPSTNGNKYLVTFVDDYSRMCWLYFLKKKSEAFQTFKNILAWI